MIRFLLTLFFLVAFSACTLQSDRASLHRQRQKDGQSRMIDEAAGSIGVIGTDRSAVVIPSDVRGTKWYPGHYQAIKSVGFSRNPPAWQRPQFVTALAHPKMQGYMLRIAWRELEKERGQYNFSQIDAVLATVGARGKHLILNVSDRSFRNEPGGNAPDYVSGSGCMFPLEKSKTESVDDTKGLALKWYQSKCVDLFINLYRALGRRYDQDERLWAITIGSGESALSGAPRQSDYTTPSVHLDQLIRAAKEVKTVFPTTLVLTGCNYLPAKGESDRLGDSLERFGGSGLSHPDTVPGKEFPCSVQESKRRRNLAVVPQGQQSQISDTMVDAENKIFSWAVHQIGAHAFVWGDWGHDRYVMNRVLPFLDRPESSWPSESQECPSTLKPCLN